MMEELRLVASIVDAVRAARAEAERDQAGR
jgi:hypothetical protein